jgi:hypothetical protein
MNVSEIDKENFSNEELIKRKEIESTPFVVVTINGKSFGSMGAYRLTESFDTEEEAENTVTKMTWNSITNVIMCIMDATLNNLKKQ